MIGRAAGLSVLVVVNACAWVQPAWLDMGSACGTAATHALSTVDWTEAMAIPITISSGEFQPMVIELRRDRSYLFQIVNRDDETRIVYAPSFLHTVAIGGVRVDGEDRDDTCLTQLLLPAHAAAEIRLRPLRRGQYRMADSLIPIGVWGAGVGTIRVE